MYLTILDFIFPELIVLSVCCRPYQCRRQVHQSKTATLVINRYFLLYLQIELVSQVAQYVYPIS